MSDKLQQTVGQLVAQRPARARVFEKLGIDFCCGGGRTLQSACEKKNVDPAMVAAMLDVVDDLAKGQTETDCTGMSLTALADHIEQTHHAYLRNELPRVQAMIQKVVNAHGHSDLRLKQVLDIFNEFNAELTGHMQKEEQVLFPLIRQLDSGNGSDGFHCGSVSNPIRVMEQEHDSAGNALEQMHELTEGYVPPQWACNTYRAMLDSLHQIESDMHQHVHKENNILFPRAIEVESKLAHAAG